MYFFCVVIMYLTDNSTGYNMVHETTQRKAPEPNREAVYMCIAFLIGLSIDLPPLVAGKYYLRNGYAIV